MKMREISASRIENAVKGLCIKANTSLRRDVLDAIRKAYTAEKDGRPAKKMLKILLENAEIA